MMGGAELGVSFHYMNRTCAFYVVVGFINTVFLLCLRLGSEIKDLIQ